MLLVDHDRSIAATVTVWRGLTVEVIVAQRPRPLDPERSPTHMLGAHLRALREAQGLSQAQLGSLVFCSPDLIRRIETATRRAHPGLISRCDEALSAAGRLSALMAAASGSRVTESVTSVAVTSLPALRRVLDSSDCPPDGPTRDVADLAVAVAELVDLRLQSRYDELAVPILQLLSELHRASLQAGAAATAGLLIQAYRAADAIADKYGITDLSARIIDAMRHQAAGSDDPVDAATVAYVRAEVFMTSGDFDAGRRMLERAIAVHRPTRDPVRTAATGALHMRCAILAARAGDIHDVGHHLDAADRYAARLTDGVYRGTAFGPSSVRIHRLTAALDGNDSAAAVTAGRGWQPSLLVPAERRSHFHIDLARAWLDTGHPDESVSCLYRAFDAAPQHARHHAKVRAVIARLSATSPRPSQDLINLTKWAGVRLS